jgi:hypothetical protein
MNSPTHRGLELDRTASTNKETRGSADARAANTREGAPDRGKWADNGSDRGKRSGDAADASTLERETKSDVLDKRDRRKVGVYRYILHRTKYYILSDLQESAMYVNMSCVCK